MISDMTDTSTLPLDKAAIDRAALSAAERIAAKLLDEERLGEMIRKQMYDVLARGTEHEKAVILARVPYICQDIKNIDARLLSIEGNITWGVRIVIGAVIMAVLGLVFVNAK